MDKLVHLVTLMYFIIQQVSVFIELNLNTYHCNQVDLQNFNSIPSIIFL